LKHPYYFALCVEVAPTDATTMLAAPRQRSRAALLAQRSHDFCSGDHASAARVAWRRGDRHYAESASEGRAKIPCSASLDAQNTEKTRVRAGVLGCAGKDTD